VACSAALGVVIGAQALRIPNTVAYIGDGLLLGPAFGVLEVTHTVELIAEFGIVLLLFLVGLKLISDKIQEIGRTALVAGGVQMTGTALGAGLLACCSGMGPSSRSSSRSRPSSAVPLWW